jgi:hypothetical protein
LENILDKQSFSKWYKHWGIPSAGLFLRGFKYYLSFFVTAVFTRRFAEFMSAVRPKRTAPDEGSMDQCIKMIANGHRCDPSCDAMMQMSVSDGLTLVKASVMVTVTGWSPEI